ncbi:hypothetical protein ASE00_07330 [Sphingomonas sp. Root710]|uniref:MarR family winged helix-turn-helix transcriptional regulator n=1 Tax=Sphingomonas sp. Root710 TaxID=1736594 RepID=UPI0006FEFEDF|nr:MarR family winged helix-turn-helix transcriptional regulator [Sphingomonas sp. Root710]KRB86503.1 hypothetical protein ASE00_07330 [Sphingomonas sp. Root710]
MAGNDLSTGDGENLPDYQNALGFLVRQLYQIVLALFLEVSSDIDVTPVQYAALQAIRDNPDNDQRLIGGLIAVDRTTINVVSLRLEQKGWIVRHVIGGRRLHLELTQAGRQVLIDMAKVIPAHAERILAPLEPAQRDSFMAMLKTLVEQNNDLSRAPLQGQAAAHAKRTKSGRKTKES